jgi:hypothetical protein
MVRKAGADTFMNANFRYFYDLEVAGIDYGIQSHRRGYLTFVRQEIASRGQMAGNVSPPR